MLFEWDSDKDEINQNKHGISFETATQVFFDPNIITTTDLNSDGEERWQTVGSVGNYTVLLVIHTYRDKDGAEIIRLISARKLSKGEVKKYGYH